MMQPPSLSGLQAENPAAGTRKRLLLADDHALFLEELRGLLEQHYEIAGTAADGRALTEAARSLEHDLIISDVSMPGMSGLEAAATILARDLGAKIILLTVESSAAYVKRARVLGARGYVLKVRVSEDLLTAVSRVLDGETFVSPEFADSWQRE